MNESDIYEYALDRLAAGADPERVIQELADAQIPGSRVRDIVGSASGDLIRRDHYEVLGVSRAASTHEIKTAYRQKALQYHPDRNINPGAAERFKQINEIYQTLIDLERRADYDRSLPNTPSSDASAQQATKRSGAQGSPAYQASSSRYQTDELITKWQDEDIFYYLINEDFIGSLITAESESFSRSDAIAFSLMEYMQEGFYTSEVTKAIVICMFNKNITVQRFVEEGRSQSFAEEIVEEVSRLIRDNFIVRHLVCAKYLDAGGSPLYLIDALIASGLSQSDAQKAVLATAQVMQQKSERRIRCGCLILAGLVIVGLIIYIIIELVT